MGGVVNSLLLNCIADFLAKSINEILPMNNACDNVNKNEIVGMKLECPGTLISVLH